MAITIDIPFIEELNAKGGEGGLLLGGPGQTVQLCFIFSILDSLKPKKILEIGTHRANFCYFAKLICPDSRITTFGINPESEDSVYLVNKKFNNNDVTFVLGNSIETVPRYNDSFDFAWVDGAHDFETTLADLNNCADKNIPYIMFDDVVGDPGAHDALVEFLKTRNQYKMCLMSPDPRGIVLLSNVSMEESEKWNFFIGKFVSAIRSIQV